MLGCFYKKFTYMSVPGFSNPQFFVFTSTGILSRYKTKIRCELLCCGKTVKIPNFNNNGKCCMCFYTDKTRKFSDRFLIFILCCKFFNPFIQALNLIAQYAVSMKVFIQYFSVDGFRI